MIALAWNGQSGFCQNDELIGVFNTKPALSFQFDVLSYDDRLGKLKVKIKGGVLSQLTEAEKTACRQWAIDNADMQTGGSSIDPVLEAWFVQRENDPRFTAEKVAQLEEFDLWYNVRKDDPRFDSLFEDWMIERMNDPRFTVASQTALTQWINSPKVTTQDIAWIEDRKVDPRFTADYSSKLDTLGAMISDLQAMLGWYGIRKDDPRFTGIPASVTVGANLANSWADSNSLIKPTALRQNVVTFTNGILTRATTETADVIVANLTADSFVELPAVSDTQRRLTVINTSGNRSVTLQAASGQVVYNYANAAAAILAIGAFESRQLVSTTDGWRVVLASKKL